MYIEEYIKEAIENKKVVIIQNKKSGKYFEVIALEVREKKLFYLFSSSKIKEKFFYLILLLFLLKVRKKIKSLRRNWQIPILEIIKSII